MLQTISLLFGLLVGIIVFVWGLKKRSMLLAIAGSAIVALPALLSSLK